MDPSKDALAINPSGAPPNFVDPPSLQGTILGSGITLMIISAALLSLRLYANLRHTGRLGVDDVLCLIGWTTAVALWAITYSMAADGTSRHAWDVPLSLINESYMKRTFAQEIIGTCSMWAVKACVLTLFIRIFNSVRWMRVTAYILLVLTGIFHLACVAIWIANTAPHPGMKWASIDQLEKSSSKLLTGTVVATGVFSVAVDCIMFALPFPIIAGLQLGTRQKIRLILVFSVALW
ncbi:Nn.00g048280.m01.CDS01 [Neocucurbitaria sp. VM-36]